MLSFYCFVKSFSKIAIAYDKEMPHLQTTYQILSKRTMLYYNLFCNTTSVIVSKYKIKLG